MLSYATEFPLPLKTDVADFVAVLKQWLLGSPFNAFEEKDIEKIGSAANYTVNSSDNALECIHLADVQGVTFGLRHSSRSDGAEWRTEIVFSKTDGDVWVGVRTYRDSDQPTLRLPSAKKPYVIKSIIETLGGGIDGHFTVSDAPIYLTAEELVLAGELIDGESTSHLPVVYISSRFDGGYSLDPIRLSRTISGSAHVVVEPNRRFSNNLQQMTFGRNVYGGSIGLFFPKNSQRRVLFLGDRLSSPADLAEQITFEIRAALLNRRPMSRCSWAGVQEAAARIAVAALKQAGSSDLAAFTEAFDQENSALKLKLSQAEEEIEHLRTARSSFAEISPNTLAVSTGSEQNFFEGEILEIVMSALNERSNNVQQDSRRQHILKALVENNPLTSIMNSKKSELKSLLKGYRNLTPGVKKGLEKLGFEISEDGKHYKLNYMEDDRYTFSLAKSGSDHRGGENAVSDIAKRIF
jgi:hypothetical protein